MLVTVYSGKMGLEKYMPRSCWVLNASWVSLIAGLILCASSTEAQNIKNEVVRFSCDGIWRDGDHLESKMDASTGSDAGVFVCVRRSCVSRERNTAHDGSILEVVRSIYILPGEAQYIATYTLWKGESLEPFVHRASVRQFSNCTNTGEFAQRWSLDFGDVRYEGDAVYALPKNEGAASFFHAPSQYHGDWSGYNVITFEKLSSIQQTFDTHWQEIKGDVVLDNGDMRALYRIPSIHDGEWHSFRVLLDDPDWNLSGGARSMADILENVTSFRIRAEYGPIEGETAIRKVFVE